MVGMQNGIATLGDSLVVSSKMKHPFPVRSSDHASWYLLIGIEKLIWHKNLYTDIYNSFIHKSGQWNAILKGNELSSHEKTWKKLKCMLLSEIRQTAERHYPVWLHLYDIWKRQNYGGSKISNYQECMGERWWWRRDE